MGYIQQSSYITLLINKHNFTHFFALLIHPSLLNLGSSIFTHSFCRHHLCGPGKPPPPPPQPPTHRHPADTNNANSLELITTPSISYTKPLANISYHHTYNRSESKHKNITSYIKNNVKNINKSRTKQTNTPLP